MPDHEHDDVTPGEDDWTELQPDSVTSGFVERTLTQAMAARGADQRWRQALATYAPPVPATDFVANTWQKILDDRATTPRDVVLAALESDEHEGVEPARVAAPILGSSHWLRFAAVAAIMLAVLGLPFLSALRRPPQPITQTALLRSDHQWAARLAQLGDDGLAKPAIDPVLIVANVELGR